ncbi:MULTISPECIES: ABC transporter substrate-binding protein [unclassified Bradyrhizobium]|uniref:ABC transporter substrate-binding protein n=1 Tax=unclassified Bradyrhizobium TaxID=2631580 RepID=UPI001FF7B696|nr:MULTISPECIES: ABC transporter substrate-binding protein [unclassified Bradyrhizobium]MCK1522885.1 ABC transporter substrate-binding protein [Bradyrhizobium sp. 17]MCK1686636.1 ABC transporter substrate-binding protein [Bradyrhizobium sp. 145]
MKVLAYIFGASVLAITAYSSAQADAGRTMRIGILNDASGPYSDNAGEGSVTAAKMAAEDFMQQHPNFKVEIISADHQNKADVGVAIARRWIDQDKVDAVADVPNSAVGLAVNEVVRGSKAALIASSAASSDLTGKYCSPNTIQWTFDTWAASHTIGNYLVHHGGKKWYFIATDNALGKSMVRDGTSVISAGGGTVLGSVNVPINNADYASFILQADASGADVIAFATAGGDTVNLIKQSSEFGLKQSGKTFAALLTTTNDVEASGLAVGQGLIITQPFYWDLNDASRAWSARFSARQHGQLPTAFHAGVYSSVLAYLNAALAAGTNDAQAVIRKMKEAPIDDELFGLVVVRADGRAIHNMYILKVKDAKASKAKWDLLENVGVLSGLEAFRPISQGGCAMIEQSKGN